MLNPYIINAMIMAKLRILYGIIRQPHCKYAPSPPVAAEIFGKIERCDFITRSHRSVYITTWLISLFRVEPLVTALSALFECSSHAGEQFSICVAVIILIVFLASCAVAGVKHLILFSAWSGGCAYSVGSHFCCHNIAV